MQVHRLSWSMRCAALFFAAATLAACGGGGGDDAPAPAPAPEALFIPGNAWNGAPPADADTISPDEFRRRVAAGELTVVTDRSPEAQRQARQQRFDQDRAFLESQAGRSDTLNALLTEAATNGPDFGRTTTLPSGKRVAPMDLGTRINQAAGAWRETRDPAVARAAYSMAFSLLPAASQGQLHAPSSLANASLDEIDQAATQLDAALGALNNLDNARLDPAAVPAATSVVRRMNAGNGTDVDGNCTPTGLHARYWFPLKRYVSPVKDQGERGVCWAFTAIGAVESRERVQNDSPVDLSEQYLINKVRREWDESDYNEGYNSKSALNAAVDRAQGLILERDWTYNRSPGRPDNAQDPGIRSTDKSYVGACDGYTGLCSLSAHQSPRSCTTVVFTFCGFNTVNLNGDRVTTSRVQRIWSTGRPFNLNHYRALLAAGYSLIGALPLHETFNAVGNTGIVPADYSRTMRDGAGTLVNGSYGAHEVQVVGFLSNEELSYPGSPVNIDGGGYFIVRNSWGCSAGDAGYYYVPAEYVRLIFGSLDVLDFDGRRSPQWTADQVTPGASDPLQIDPQGASTFELRLPSNLAGHFRVRHPAASYVRLTVQSALDGVLYDGQWAVNPPVGGSLFANALPVNFQSAGPRKLIITARYGNQVATVEKDVVVHNSAPEVRIAPPGPALQGETTVIQALLTDRNEPDNRAMCASLLWEVDAPDTIEAGDGCLRTVRFNVQGERRVRITATDREGLTGSNVVSLIVGPPPVNPYPRVWRWGVYSRDAIMLQGTQIGCTENPVADGATINLTRLACRTSIFVQDDWHFVARLEVENPANEALTYDWRYRVGYEPGGGGFERIVTTRTTTPRYSFAPVAFGAMNAANWCELRVTVNAPDPARSKSQSVWSGLCINSPGGPG